MCRFIKAEFTLDSYKLENVANHFLGEKKDGVHFTEIPVLQMGDEHTR